MYKFLSTQNQFFEHGWLHTLISIATSLTVYLVGSTSVDQRDNVEQCFMIYTCDGKTTTFGKVFELSWKDDEDPEYNSNDELCKHV